MHGLDHAPGPLERLITMKTAECEGIEVVGELLERACAAVVQSVEPIPDSHNRQGCGGCGAVWHADGGLRRSELPAGLITAYVADRQEVIHGIESDGMLASGAELGINRDHTGIVELESQVGAPVAGCVPDRIIEIDNKSITHRPDLWGHHGMAREVAAIQGFP